MTSKPHISFNVSRTRDGKICGQVSGCVMHADGRNVTWLTTPFGVPAKDAFPEALQLARDHGIEQINIQDPHGLFPSLGFGDTQRGST